MSDVLFRYLLTARSRDKSALRRLVFVDEPLLAAGVEQLVESAAARIEVKSQHERVERLSRTVPASRRHKVKFYDVARPNRPLEGHFERRREEFPLEKTLRVYLCTTCQGTGEVRCRTCSGQGRTRCRRCRGSGRSDSGRCRRCGGDGRLRCDRCRGRCRVTCGSCRGEGQLASWESEIYRWLVENRSADEYPAVQEKPRLVRPFGEWLAIDKDRVASLQPAEVARHLGFETAESREVAKRAESTRLAIESEARLASDRYLFHRTEVSLTPVGYTVSRLQGRAQTYWLVGRGERAVEAPPRGRLDGLKCTGWLGLGSGGAMAYESLMQTYQLAAPLFESLQLLGGIEPVLLAGGSAASWLMTLAGVRRVNRHKSSVQVIGLLPPSGRPTAFLSCLAYIGSYLGHLRVLDSAYDIQSQRLLGTMRNNHQSESLSIELPDGRKIRLVEVAQPLQLEPGQLRLMVRALDGMMILEEPQHDAPATRKLTARLEQVAEAPLTLRRLRIDRSAAARLDDVPDALPLESARCAFVHDMSGRVDWQQFFESMWRPLDELFAAAPTVSEEEAA